MAPPKLSIVSVRNDDPEEARRFFTQVEEYINNALSRLSAYDALTISSRLTALENWTYTSPTSSTIVVGGGGSSTDVSLLSSQYPSSAYPWFLINEVAATPGFTAEFNFTNITGFNRIYIEEAYDGSNTHNVRLEIWDQVNSAWVEVTGFKMAQNAGAIECLLVPWVDDTNFIDGSGNVKMRVNHASAGNAAHALRIRFMALIS